MEKPTSTQQGGCLAVISAHYVALVFINYWDGIEVIKIETPYLEIYHMIDEYLVAIEKQSDSDSYAFSLYYHESELFYKGMFIYKFADMVRQSSWGEVTCEQARALGNHGCTQELMQHARSVEHLWVLSQQGIHAEKV